MVRALKRWGRKGTLIGGGFLVLVIGVTATLTSYALTQSSPSSVSSVFKSTDKQDVLPMLNGFKSLPSATVSENTSILLSINSNATADERAAAAKADGYPKPGNANARYDLSNTEYLGGVRTAYQAANAAKEVPLVNTLLAEANHDNSSHMDLDTEWPSSDGAKSVYKNQRPYCTGLNKSIKRVSGSGIYSSDAACAQGNYSFPSGHSRIVWTEGVSLAIMLPELAPQIMARSAEIANYRVVLGVHYPLDIMGGRALATRMVAARLHDKDWRAKFDAAKTQLRAAIVKYCHTTTVAECVAANPPTMSTADALAYERAKLTYGFTQTGASGVALSTTPSYAYELLSEVYPDKSADQLNQILKDTAIDSGYPLDTTGTSAGAEAIGWTRFDLGKALTDAGSTSPVTPPSQTTPTSPAPTVPTTPAPATCKAGAFSDIAAGSPACESTTWLKDKGLVDAYADGSFQPQATVTREEMSAILYRYARLSDPSLPAYPACTVRPFTDVPIASSYCGAVAWMKSTGITTGYSDGSFHPVSKTSREAMAAFTYRYYRLTHASLPAHPSCAASPFTDVATTDAFCGEIQSMKDHAVASGYGDGSFHPSESITREAMAAYMYRLDKNLTR